MFDKHIVNIEDRSVEAAGIIANSHRMLSHEMEAISKAEIESKDRVDIPLKEYLKMKRTINELEWKCQVADATFMKIGIPTEVIDKIDPRTICVESSHNPCDFKKEYRIRFSIDIGMF